MDFFCTSLFLVTLFHVLVPVLLAACEGSAAIYFFTLVEAYGSSIERGGRYDLTATQWEMCDLPVVELCGASGGVCLLIAVVVILYGEMNRFCRKYSIRFALLCVCACAVAIAFFLISAGNPFDTCPNDVTTALVVYFANFFLIPMYLGVVRLLVRTFPPLYKQNLISGKVEFHSDEE